MKKCITIVLTIISMFSFLILFNDENAYQLSNMKNAEQKENSYKILIPSEISNKPQEEVYKKITEVLDKYNGNIYYSRLSKGTDSYIIKYVYLNDMGYFDNFTLNSGRFFYKSENESDKFISTKDMGNPNQIGEICEFAGDNNFEIHTLKGMIKDHKLFEGDCLVQLPYNVSIQSFNKELGDALNVNISTNSNDITPIINTYANLKVIISLYFIILLMVLYGILTSYKQIGVLKMLGTSTLKLWLNKMLLLISVQIIVNIIITCVASLYKIKEFNLYYWPFMVKVILIQGILIVASVIVCSIPYIFINKITVSSMLKNKKPMKEIVVFNTIVKMLFIGAFLILCIQGIQNYGKVKNIFELSFSKWEDTKQYAVIGTYKNMPAEYRMSEEFTEKEKELYEYFNERGAIYADFNDFSDTTRSYNLKDHPEPWWSDWVTVNPNYLKENPVYDIQGNQIVISESDENYIVLIPDKYQTNEAEIRELLEFWKRGDNCKVEKQSIKIMWIKSNQKLFSYNIGVNSNDGNYVSNCFIRVTTESNASYMNYACVADYSGAPFKIKVNNSENPAESILPQLEKFKLDVYDPSIYLIYDTVAAESKEIKDLIKWIGGGILILGIAVLVIMFQNIYSFFELNRQRIAIQKFHGYKKIHKYGDYFLIMYLSWIIVFDFVLLICKFNLLQYIGITLSIGIRQLFFLVVFLALFETIISLFMLSIVEKRKVIKVIKGS